MRHGRHLGDREEGGLDDQGVRRCLERRLDGGGGPEGAPVVDHRTRFLPLPSPLGGGQGVEVDPALGGHALAAPIAPVVEQQDRRVQARLQYGNHIEPVADVARIAVEEDQRHARPAGEEPGMEPYSVGSGEEDLLVVEPKVLGARVDAAGGAEDLTVEEAGHSGASGPFGPYPMLKSKRLFYPSIQTLDRFGRDSMTYVPERVLVCTPHPDDAEMGVGGTVTNWMRQGAEATLVVVTNGDKGSSDLEMTSERLVEIRECEQLAARRGAGLEGGHLPP